MRQVGRIELEALQQQRVELRLDGPDGHVLAVLGLVDLVERGAGIEHVDAALVRPRAATAERPHHVRESEGAVDHRRVHDLALAGGLTLDEGGQDAEHEEHRTATEVADHVQRRHRALTLAADGVQDAGQRDVVDVVAGRVGERALLAPAGHAAVDDARVALEDHIRPEAEPFGDAGTEALDEDVGALEQGQDLLDVGGILEVGLDDATVALNRIALSLLRDLAGALHDDDIGAEIGEQRRGVRAGTETLELDDADTRERTLLLNSFSGHSTNLTPIRRDCRNGEYLSERSEYGSGHAERITPRTGPPRSVRSPRRPPRDRCAGRR